MLNNRENNHVMISILTKIIVIMIFAIIEQPYLNLNCDLNTILTNKKY